jgi:hypothetical protein
VQSAHIPLAPHAVEPEPPAHIPPEQQPPLHGCVDEQLVVQVWLVPSQAEPIGQSAAELQPHAPPPDTVRQTEPSALPMQVPHAVPVAPQLVVEVPLAQVEPLQQPPLHGCVDEQVLVHWCEVASHA